MISADNLSLARQMDIVFKELEVELGSMNSGTLFVHIRNNVIGKFGVRHNPIAGRDGSLAPEGAGLDSEQLATFRAMALDSLRFKRSWTHGEMSFDFTVRKDKLMMDATLESNYNMANLLIQRYPNRSTLHTYKESNSA